MRGEWSWSARRGPSRCRSHRSRCGRRPRWRPDRWRYPPRRWWPARRGPCSGAGTVGGSRSWTAEGSGALNAGVGSAGGTSGSRVGASPPAITTASSLNARTLDASGYRPYASSRDEPPADGWLDCHPVWAIRLGTPGADLLDPGREIQDSQHRGYGRGNQRPGRSEHPDARSCVFPVGPAR
jgi:hypothetical protein